MAARPKGICSYCGEEIAKQSTVKHLHTCAKRVAAIDAATGKTERLFYLRAECEFNKGLFLDLEVRGSATLNDLDRYLRAIWLECCGHMSEFAYKAWEDTIDSSRKVESVFKTRKQITHLYDMGSTSETTLRVLAERKDAPTTERPLALMVRNKMPEASCDECGKPARWMCNECLAEEGKYVALCDDCLEPHGHLTDYPPTLLINSPRMGMCAYEGPAEAPY
ncbi:hypothetical protein [Armatimonas sp.]|uniref:hypothetical protein n=1 Tax=Armatimonas sp. TaxID=1872638 RepID=UPI00286A8119|nr:hypothetical protein [Armatimonas sp.]